VGLVRCGVVQRNVGGCVFSFSFSFQFCCCQHTCFRISAGSYLFYLLFQLVAGLVRVGVKVPQDGNRANMYEHLYVVRGHVWRTLCSVCKTGARVAQPVPCNS
jgi:hypothetical protein